MKLPSISKLERVLECPASHLLPQEVEPPSEYAVEGTRRHEALARALCGRQVPSELAGWVRDVLDEAPWLEAPGIRIEVAVSWDPVWGVGEVLGEHLGREYGDRMETAYCGSADYVRVPHGELEVVDLKTGAVPVAVEGNVQLLTLALALRDATEAHTVRVGILSAPPGQMPHLDWAEVTDEQLESHAEKLRALEATLRAYEARPEAAPLREGPHCKYCPARRACPAKARNEAEALALPQKPRIEVTVENAGEVWALVDRAREVIDELKAECIRVALANGGVRMPDGKVRKQVVRTVATWDASVVWQVLASRFGPEVARAAMTLETSKAGIERGVSEAKRLGAEGTKAALLREVLQAVEAAGGRGEKTRTEWVDEEVT